MDDSEHKREFEEQGYTILRGSFDPAEYLAPRARRAVRETIRKGLRLVRAES